MLRLRLNESSHTAFGNIAFRRKGKMHFLKSLMKVSIPALLLAAAAASPAAQLSTDARTAIPHDVRASVVIDYRAMQNSTEAMSLRFPVNTGIQR
jgi:hypothetical protein